MTRLDLNENKQFDTPDDVVKLQQELDKLKKSLKRKENKKVFSCRNCLGIAIICLLVLAGLVAYLIAKSGLVEVPYFSAKFYQEPVPTYLVKNSNPSGSESDLVSIIKQKVATLPVKGDKNFDLQITDYQLTAQIQKLVQDNQTLTTQIDYSQVAVLPESLELFIKKKAPSMVIITFNIVPSIKNDKLDLAFVNFQIGTLRLPNWLANFSLGWVAEQGLNNLWQNLQPYGNVKEIKLQKGYLQLKVITK